MKGRYRFHLWYFTESVTRLVPVLTKLREEFPMDKDIIDVLDVDAVSLS
jgi:primosomal protein N' (replication factor Y)